MIHSVFSRNVLRLAVTIFAANFLSGCVSLYVDSGLSSVNAEQIKKPAQPKSTQILFNFQTKGAQNAAVTNLLKTHVAGVVASTGMFSVISPDPVPGGTILSIVIDNVPITDQSDAAAKGFVTGLTFGLAGSTVTDGYICTIEYVSSSGAEKLSAVSHHAIHTTVGAKGAPKDAIKARNGIEAVQTMSQQVITTALIDLSKDPSFR